MLENSHIHFEKKNIIFTLVRFNFQWYQQVMKDILFRYKIFLLFVVATLISTLANVSHLITLPVEGFLSNTTTSVAGLVISWIMYQAFSLAWIKLHQPVVTNQPWQSYISSLQISNRQKLLVDVSILSIINTLLWMPLLFFIFKTISMIGFMNFEFLLVIGKSTLIILLVLLIQLSWMKKKLKLIVPVFFINILIIPSMIYLNTGLQIASISTLIVAALFAITLTNREILTSFKNKILENQKKISQHNKYKSFPFIRVQTKNLWANRSQLSMTLSTLIAMNLIAIAILFYGTMNPLLPFILSNILIFNSLSISNLFKQMDLQWHEYTGFISSLPVTQLRLFLVNFAIATFLSLACHSIILIMASLYKNNLAYRLAPSLIISLVFLLATYLPQVKMNRYGFFVSFCLMIGFSYCNYLLMTLSG